MPSKFYTKAVQECPSINCYQNKRQTLQNTGYHRESKAKIQIKWFGVHEKVHNNYVRGSFKVVRTTENRLGWYGHVI